MKTNRRQQLLALAGCALGAVVIAAFVGPLSSTANPPAGSTGRGGNAVVETLPDQLQISAVIRDFRGKAERGGHPDFESFTGSGRVGLVGERLGADGKPIFRSSNGRQLASDFKDSAGRPIPYFLFDSSRRDVSAAITDGNNTNGITSAASFQSWYNDTPGMNMSKVTSLTFNRVAGTNRYIFDSANDQPYKTLGGFYPINGELFGNFGSTNKNYHFTTELDARFVYERGTGQVFTFTGDDDVWCFIDGRLVIDLGGVHPKKAQTLELDRLTWLADNKAYQFKIFHAERRTVQSNFRVETTLKLVPVQPPAVTDSFD